jgi:hypothetical protein
VGLGVPLVTADFFFFPPTGVYEASALLEVCQASCGDILKLSNQQVLGFFFFLDLDGNIVVNFDARALSLNSSFAITSV